MRRTIAAVVLTLALAACPAQAWHGRGHELAARASMAVLSAGPDEPDQEHLPEFFLSGAEAVAHFSQDPDAFTRPIAPPELHEREAPEHYFDLELIRDLTLPGRRYDFLELCFERKLKPSRVGLLPYALVENTQRLSVALAEHRKWPDDPNIQAKCLVYAGLLAHYAADACQPLHMTIHYDGRARPDGSSPRTGIHAKVDALLGKLKADPSQMARGLKAAPYEQLNQAVLDCIAAGHGVVERVYELESELPAGDAPLTAGSKVGQFAEDRLQAAAEFTASLWLTAWRDSEKLELPPWHVRGRAQAATTAPTTTPTLQP